MNDLKNINLSRISDLRRYHMVIFIVTVAIGLTAAVLLLNSVVLKANDPTTPSGGDTVTSFDQTTIDRIKQLKTADEPSVPLDFSKGRISPFSE